MGVDNIPLTLYETLYTVLFMDQCNNPTITPSALGPLSYDLDTSGIVQATFPEFAVTPSYCIKGYTLGIPGSIQTTVVTGDPDTRTFSIDKDNINWALADSYDLTATPILRDDTILTGSKAIYSLTLIDPCRNPTITPSKLGPLSY